MAASGGSLSNLMALVMARFISGLETDPNAMFFASEDSHVSLSKSVRIMGLNQDALQIIPSDEEGKLDMTYLYSTFNKIRSEGKQCFAVVATAGTTVRGAIDPISDISKFCRDKNIWLHGDYCEKTYKNGYIIYGRSDATLNAGGIRLDINPVAWRRTDSTDAVGQVTFVYVRVN